MRILLGLLLLTFLGALGIFALENLRSVEVRFLNWGVTLPLALVVVASYVLGMVSGWTVIGLFRRAYRRVSERPVTYD